MLAFQANWSRTDFFVNSHKLDRRDQGSAGIQGCSPDRDMRWGKPCDPDHGILVLVYFIFDILIAHVDDLVNDRDLRAVRQLKPYLFGEEIKIV